MNKRRSSRWNQASTKYTGMEKDEQSVILVVALGEFRFFPATDVGR